MSDLRQCTHDFLGEFLELYKSFPCLWQVKSKDYSDRNKKNVAYEELIKKYKETDMMANKETVTKKINSLKSVYKKELKTVRASEISGSREEDVYKPSLWYFDLLEFLNDQDIPRMPQETINNDEESCFDEQQSGNHEETSDEEHDNIASTSGDNTNSLIGTPSSVSSSLKRKRAESRKKHPRSTDKEVLQILSMAERKLDFIATSDSFDTYGKHMADRLRQMKPGQVKFVQKLISDVLYEGEMESLNANCKLTVIGQRELQFLTSSVGEAHPPHSPHYGQTIWPQFWQPQQVAHQSGIQKLAHLPGMQGIPQPAPVQSEIRRPVTTSPLTNYITTFSDSNP